MQVLCEYGWQTLTPGSAMVIPPNTPYKCKCATASASFLWVHFTGSDAKNILERYKIGLFPCIHKTATVNNISARFQKLFEGFATNDLYRVYDLSSLLDRLLIETDCPYMAPVPFRGQRCDSTMLHKTAERLAEIKGVSKECLIEKTRDNAIKVFELEELI